MIRLIEIFKKMEILRNLSSVLLGNMVARLAGFLSIMYLARILGPSTLGIFSFGLAVVSYFTVFVTFGLDDFGVLHVASDRSSENIEKHLGNLLGLRITISIICFILLICITYFVPQIYRHQGLFLILGISLFICAFNFEWLFIAVERMEFSAIARSISRMSYLILTVLLIKSSKDILMCAIISVFSEAMMPIILIFSLSRFTTRFKISFNVHQWGHIIRYNLPLSIASVVGLIRMNADLVILGFLATAPNVGLYAAVLSLINVGILFCSLARQVMFSRIVRSYQMRENKNQFGIINATAIKYGIIFGVLFGLLGTVFASQIIVFIFGNRFLQASSAFRVGIWVISLNFMGVSLPHAVMTHDRMAYLRMGIFSGILNISLNLFLIPILGIMGSAISYLISTFLWIGLSYYQVCVKNRLFSLNLIGLFLKPCLSFIVCVVLMCLFKTINDFIAIFASAITYIGILYLTKHVSFSQIKADLKRI